MKRYLLLLLCVCGAILTTGQGIPPISVTEADGSPRITSVRRIVVSNGTLTKNGSVATITTGGGGGSPGGSDTQVQYNNAGAFGGITGLTTNGTRANFGANPLFNVGSGATDNLIYVGSGSSGAVNASFGFFVAGVGSGAATDGPYFLGRGLNFNAVANQRGMLYFSAGSPASPVGNDNQILFATGNDSVRFTIRSDGLLQGAGFTLSGLGGPPDGCFAYCTDCNVGTDPCTNTGPGTGAFAYRLNSRWYCP